MQKSRGRTTASGRGVRPGDEYPIGQSSRSGEGRGGERRGRKRNRRKRSRVIAARLVFTLMIIAVAGLVLYGGYRLISAVTGRVGSDADTTTVTVLKNGSIRETIVEEFNPGFYDEESLRSDIESKIKAAGGSVESEGFETDGGIAKLKLRYDSDEAMAAFNDEVFYAGTIDDLVSRGVSFDSEAVKSGGTHAVIVSEAMDIRVPKKILYSDGAITIDPDDPKLAHCITDEGELAFIIY